MILFLIVIGALKISLGKDKNDPLKGNYSKSFLLFLVLLYGANFKIHPLIFLIFTISFGLESPIDPSTL